MLVLPILLYSLVSTCAADLGPASVALQHNDPAKALELLEGFRPQCGQSSAFYELLGLANELSGKTSAAEEALRAAVALEPGSPRLLTELGATYFRNGKPREAAKVLDQALALEPSNAVAMKYAIGSAVQSGAWPRAATLFRQLGAETHPESLQNDPILVLWFAQTLIETGHTDRIEPLFSPQQKLMSPGLLFSLGTLFAQHRMYDHAVEYLRLVPDQNADDAVYFNLGLSYSHLKKFDQAREYYFRAIDKKSGHADAYLHVGLDYVVSGAPNLGIPWVFRAHALAPERPDISYALVQQLVSLGYSNTAQEVLVEAVANHPHDALLAVANGDLKRSNGDPAAAIESYQRALAEQPGLTAALVGLARANIVQGKEGEAQKFLKTALSGDPDDPFASGELGLLEAHQEEWDAALEHLNRAWTQDRSNGKIAIELARAYRHKGRPQQALQVLTSLKPAMDESSALHFELAQLYAELHQPAVAQAERDAVARIQANTHEALHFDSPRTYVH